MPLVSVLLATRNDAEFLPDALESMLRQTVADLELLVVDDTSSDGTPELLAAMADPRLKVLRNDEQAGLAASLNRALEEAQGQYVARLDSDDVSLPTRLERQLGRLAERDQPAIVGTAVLDIDGSGALGTLHRQPSGRQGVRWQALFGSPFFHPTVVIDRERVGDADLSYDTSYLESEDYDLWTRLLVTVDGANLRDPLVLKRVHARQASLRRGELQSSFQQQVALRQIGRLAPELDAHEVEAAWLFGTNRSADPDAASAYLRLLETFERRYGSDSEVRDAAVRALLGAGQVTNALRLGVAHPGRLALRGARRRLRARRTRPAASSWLAELELQRNLTRVAVVSPEPTPYRAPLLDRVAAQPELDLTVVYAAATVVGRNWLVQADHPSEFLSGRRLPGAKKILRHDYPVTPGLGRALSRLRPHVLVVSGWSTFASQAAVVWARRHGTPYILLVESHDIGPRAGWRRTVKSAVVPRLVRGAANVLAVGSAARESVIARGARPEDVRIFANTIDVEAWTERADVLARRRDELRSARGIESTDVVVLSVGRLVREKGLDSLLYAVAETHDPRLRVVLAGAGPEAGSLEVLASRLGVKLTLRGELTQEALAEEYAAADVFALLSRHETWGVVVNEAAASALPLLLSDRVGAARDLVRQGENGAVVRAGDIAQAATVLRELAGDAEQRRAFGRRSRELVNGWGYDESVANFVAAVRDAAPR
jgi:glycosyltransferase involved in cell wall biosynthesis